MSAPTHLRPWLIGLVVLGGAVGSTLRAAIAHAMPTAPGGWPWASLTVNIVGAFVLGLLLESLTVLRPENSHRRVLQLSLGTGVLGGFTTYSSFAVETLSLMLASGPAIALTYALVSVVLGFLVALAGTWLGGCLVARCGGDLR